MKYFLIKLIIYNFIENIFIYLQNSNKFHQLKILDDIHTLSKNIFVITIFSNKTKNIQYINDPHTGNNNILMRVNETQQETFSNTVLINSDEYLLIELHYPNNFENSCDNMFHHMKDII